MDVDCLANAKTTGCSVVRLQDDGSVIIIKRSVGAGGVNAASDARKIQGALNEIAAANGGAEGALTVDGLVGPRTLAAIRTFQQAHVRVVDSRIDPGGPTLAAINAEREDVVPVSAKGIGPGATAIGRKPEFQPPDPAIVTLVTELLFRVRDLIRAATFQLATADPFVKTSRLVVPTAPFLGGVRHALDLLTTIYGLDKFDNPRPSFDNIKRAFRNMDVALNRSFETAPLVASILFVPNTHISMESKAAAYTAAGGAFLSSKIRLKDLGDPADRIYVCRNILNETKVFQTTTLVHELAHYVSGQPIVIGDVVKKGQMHDKEFRAKFDAITPFEKVRSAEHYGFFSLCCRFSQFLRPK